MPELRGLPGVKGALSVQHVVSVEHALERIQKRRAVTAAGDAGALNVWRDDRRVLRSNFCRFRAVLNTAEHADVADLRIWLETWWPELGRDLPSEASTADRPQEKAKRTETKI